MTGRMLLASWGLGAVPSFVGDDPRGKVLAFIPTAAAVHPDPSFVHVNRSTLSAMGFGLREVDIADSEPDRLREQLSGVDAIFVSGGTAFYLLDRALANGFGVVLAALLADGVSYIGQSAGAVIVGPDVRPLVTVDEPGAAPGLKSMDGLGLVNFVVLPHSGVPEYDRAYAPVLERDASRLHLIPLRDDEAVLVEGDNHDVIPSPRTPEQLASR
jgi:dipeptidase E